MSLKRLVQGKGVQCPVCGNDHGCAFVGDGEIVLCLRESKGAIKPAKEGMGWLHYAKGGTKTARKLPSLKDAPKYTVTQLKAMQKRYVADLTTHRVQSLAGSLGIKSRSLQAYGVGWDDMRQVYTFPMFNGELKLCGFRFRLPNPSPDEPRYRSLWGSGNGVFVPVDYEAEKLPDLLVKNDSPLLLLMPEGPTDAASAHHLGFRAIGRFNNRGGGELLRRLLLKGNKQDVVIVADNDEPKRLRSGEFDLPGISGALSLCGAIRTACDRLRFMLPPTKDIREWLRSGATTREVVTLIEKSPDVTPDWLRRAIVKLEEKLAAIRRKAG